MTIGIEREWSIRVADNTRPTHEILVALLLLGAAAVVGSAAMALSSESPVVRGRGGERRRSMEFLPPQFRRPATMAGPCSPRGV